ncbi:hypothetical protein MMC12_000827 [Toensbergia leucococca]|nr:hypothetical protein [Toensbergia leucococca]
MGSLIPIGFECFSSTYDPKTKQLTVYVDGIVVSFRAGGGLERDTKTTDKIRYSLLGNALGGGTLSPYKRFKTSISETVSLLPPTPSPKAFVLVATEGQKDYVIPVRYLDPSIDPAPPAMMNANPKSTDPLSSISVPDSMTTAELKPLTLYIGDKPGDSVLRIFAALPATSAVKDSVVLRYDKDVLRVWESGVKGGQLYWDLTWVKKLVGLDGANGATMFQVLTNKWSDVKGLATTSQPYMLTVITNIDD